MLFTTEEETNPTKFAKEIWRRSITPQSFPKKNGGRHHGLRSLKAEIVHNRPVSLPRSKLASCLSWLQAGTENYANETVKFFENV